MNKLRERLAALANKLVPDRVSLARAQRRYKAAHKRAYRAWQRQKALQAKADKLRPQRPAAAASVDRLALRKETVVVKNRAQARYFLGRIKTLQQRIHGLETTQAQFEAELKKLDHVTIRGNKATGGTKPERLKAVALKSAAECAAGRRHNFYSQAGEFDVEHCITGESYGERSDCSSWFTSVYKSCGLADPNGQRYTAGYTGTLEAHGRQVSSPQPGDAVLYGPPGGTHHVEMYVGPGNETIGHGDARVDAGVVDDFGDGQYRFFRFI